MSLDMYKPSSCNFMVPTFSTAVLYVGPLGLTVHEWRRHHAAHELVVMGAERLFQGMAVGFIYVAQSVIRIHDLVYPRVDLLVQIVVNVQKDEPERPL